MFPVTSRYANIGAATFETPDGRTIVYLHRRFIPHSPATIVLAEHMVTQGDRLDRITALYLGDPTQFWRVADVNNAMQPEELTDDSAIGRRLLIPLPQGG
ncbi:MAG: hypothetical protein NVS4B9_14550 [Ktedonobacteraceae bacterium]